LIIAEGEWRAGSNWPEGRLRVKSVVLTLSPPGYPRTLSTAFEGFASTRLGQFFGPAAAAKGVELIYEAKARFSTFDSAISFGLIRGGHQIPQAQQQMIAKKIAAFVNYTTLGYGDVTPLAKWRLLGPMTAMNGVLMFGWSTALMFEVLLKTMERSTAFTPAKPDEL
jgi:hypothetical protein